MLKNRLSAHIGYLFTELPLHERAEAAAEAGFTAIEHPQPFAMDARELRKKLDGLGLTFAQLAGGAGDASKGEKGLASLPGREADFRSSFERALEYACIVDAPYIHPMAGVPRDDETTASTGVYLDNIHYAVEAASKTHVTVLIEAISAAAVPGYAVSTLEKAMSIQDSFRDDDVALLVDTFHAAVNRETLPAWISGNGSRIGHVHIADFPGRHEPGTGTIDFGSIISALQLVSFKGALGFEYIPLNTTTESAAFLERWKAALCNS